MEELMAQTEKDGIHLGSRAVAICSRFARHTAYSPALVSTWQMFRGVPPRSRSATLYAEMMVRVSSSPSLPRCNPFVSTRALSCARPSAIKCFVTWFL